MPFTVTFDQFNKSLLYISFKHLTDPNLLNETVIKVIYRIAFKAPKFFFFFFLIALIICVCLAKFEWKSISATVSYVGGSVFISVLISLNKQDHHIRHSTDVPL